VNQKEPEEAPWLGFF